MMYGSKEKYQRMFTISYATSMTITTEKSVTESCTTQKLLIGLEVISLNPML